MKIVSRYVIEVKRKANEYQFTTDCFGKGYQPILKLDDRVLYQGFKSPVKAFKCAIENGSSTWDFKIVERRIEILNGKDIRRNKANQS